MGQKESNESASFFAAASVVEHLGADRGAVHDGLAAVELVRVVELLEPLGGELISAVNDPPVEGIQRQDTGGVNPGSPC